MNSDYEARLLALERRVWQLPVYKLEARASGLEQAMWQSWAPRGEAPPPGCTNDFDAAFGSPCCIPEELILQDSYYGNCTLTYEPANSWWRGCRLVSYPGTANCAAATTPIRYTLFGDDTTSSWTLRTEWVSAVSGGFQCPAPGATCGSTFNQVRNSVTVFFCPPTPTKWTIFSGSSGQIHPTVGEGLGANTTLTIGQGTIAGCPDFLPDTLYANDPVYGSVALRFVGRTSEADIWTGCKVVTSAAWTGTNPCAATAGVAIHYDLSSAGTFRVRWVSSSPIGTKCPLASTCVTVTNVTGNGVGGITIADCDPFAASIALTGVDYKIFGDAAATGVTINFADTPI